MFSGGREMLHWERMVKRASGHKQILVVALPFGEFIYDALHYLVSYYLCDKKT